MASNSIRVTADLFEQARHQGEVMSRSTAQQLEHWARLGMALEASGLSVADAASILGGSSAVLRVAEPDPPGPWAAKRLQQARDFESVKAGRVSSESMHWFSGGRAKAARLKDSPY